MLSAQMKEVQNIHGLLKVEWNHVPRDLEKCGNFLSKLKVALTGLSFLPATVDAQTSAAVGKIKRWKGILVHLPFPPCHANLSPG